MPDRQEPERLLGVILVFGKLIAAIDDVWDDPLAGELMAILLGPKRRRSPSPETWPTTRCGTSSGSTR